MKRKMPRLTTAPAEPVKTHGAAHRRAPAGTHLNKKTLKRSDSAPVTAHKTLRNKDRAVPKSARNPIDRLGPFAYEKGAKLPSGKKVGVKTAKSVAKSIKQSKGY
jgi:hypothetical protein